MLRCISCIVRSAEEKSKRGMQTKKVRNGVRKKAMKHKSCFTNKHCCFSCQNAAADEFEERYDIPASDAGYERIESCKVCYLNTGECEDCLFQYSKDCNEVENDKR